MDIRPVAPYSFSYPSEIKVDAHTPEEQVRSYPGKGGTFTLVEGDWQIPKRDTGYRIVREMRFTSQTKGSLIKEFHIKGDRKGKVDLHIEFNEQHVDESVKKYLTENGVSLKHFDKYYYTEGRTPKELTKLFRILSDNNEIPEDQYDLLSALCEEGDWTKVTPLKADEHLSQNPSASNFYT